MSRPDMDVAVTLMIWLGLTIIVCLAWLGLARREQPKNRFTTANDRHLLERGTRIPR